MTTKKGAVRNRILVPLGFVLFFLIALSIFSSYHLQLRNINEHVRMRIQSVSELLQLELKKDADLLSSQTDFLEEDEKLREAWLAQDRKALLHRALPLFARMRSEHRITHFYFIGLDRICFLRVHNPERYGDKIYRFTMDRAEREGTQVWGLELGPFGTFALRVVRPWRINGKLVGYLELGEEIDHIMPALKRIVNAELLWIINKAYVERDRWREGMKTMGQAEEWDMFPNFVIINRTTEDVGPELLSYLEGLEACNEEEHLARRIATSVGQKQFRGGFSPLIDAGGRNVGDVIVLIDTTTERASLQRLLIGLVAGGISVGGLLFAFVYSFLGRVQDDIDTAHDTLVSEIRERKKAAEDLKEAMEIRSRFVSVVSHELRTPLTSMKDGIGIVLDGSVGKINAKQEKFLGLAKRNVDRLHRLINDVLDFAKLESGRAQFAMGQHDINELIREVAESQSPVAQEKGLYLKTELDEDLGKMTFDADRIVEVLSNFLNNALKHTKEGGITVTSRKDEQDAIVRVEVRDTGEGIREEDIPRIFQKFQQVDPGKRRATGSTGLGLAISKEIVERHKGRIWVESEYGKGSRFIFTLPA